jgi:hypothetical protein
MWKARQLREHRRANGLCLKCGYKFASCHKCAVPPTEATFNQLEVTTGQTTDGGGFMSEDILTALEVQDLPTQNDCFLSLIAISHTQDSKVIHLRALVNNQVLSILVDSGSSHTFLNASMLGQLGCLVTPVPSMRVRVANGQTIWSN